MGMRVRQSLRIGFGMGMLIGKLSLKAKAGASMVSIWAYNVGVSW